MVWSAASCHFYLGTAHGLWVVHSRCCHLEAQSSQIEMRSFGLHLAHGNTARTVVFETWTQTLWLKALRHL